MSQPSLTSFQVQPRAIHRHTPLIQQGQCIVTLLYPGSDSVYRQLVETLADTIESAYGVRPDVYADTDLMPTRSTPLPNRFRYRSLILLGNLNTNRALLPLYARYYCATDATYPGGTGYDLRTMVNPYGTGLNIILAGGSSLSGVTRAVERLEYYIQEAAARGDQSLPFMLEVELESGLARALAEWPDAPLSAANGPVQDGLRHTHALGEDIMKLIGAYGIMYAWTGDGRYGAFAGNLLRTLNEQMTDTYGDWHYRAERVLRVLPWLIAGGFLAEEDIQRTDQLLLGTALGTQDMWWRMRHGRPPLGHRHHGRGTFEFLLLAHYVKEQTNPNDALRDQCDRWIGECRAYLDALGRAGIDDQDDESTLTNLATVFWYALGEERFDFFEHGSARTVVRRALALHDNMGAGAGQGGYGEGLPGTLYMQQEATAAVAASAFYYQDSVLKWFLDQMPHLKSPLISGFLHFSPIFMHLFDTGPELPAVPPSQPAGLQVLPITAFQYEISTHPPEHIETAGHSVNAPETWLRGEGIGLNALPQEKGFDKLVFRGGFAPTDAYLLLQGYQAGFRWQGHMQAANCIVRFSQAGHIFLVQNTNRHSHYQKNGLFISDGYNNSPLPPIAERLTVADFASIGLSATRLKDYHHADWTRHIFWSKRGDGLFVVIDSVIFQADGSYSAICTWRTPGYARLDRTRWNACQGKHEFNLHWSEALDVQCAEETDQGASIPYVLRQTKGGDFHAGTDLSFQNLFYVRSQETPAGLAIHKLDSRQLYLTHNGDKMAWCGIADANGEIQAPGLRLRALNAWVSADEVAVSGLTSLALTETARWQIECDWPVNLCIDLATGVVSTVLAGVPDQVATLHIDIPGLASTLTVDHQATFYLSADACRDLDHALREAFVRLQPLEETNGATNSLVIDETPTWQPAWSFSNWTLLPKRLRNMLVEAVPAPLDGFAEQLIDGVINEIRQTRQQWPTAERYEITLTLPETVQLDHVRIVGDSQIDPTLRTFTPLPADVTVAVSNDHFQQDIRACTAAPEPGLLRYKLFRDIEDQLETRSIGIDQEATQIRVSVQRAGDESRLVLHEIEVYSAEQIVPPVQYLVVADLMGNGERTIVIATAASELIVLSADGGELWRHRLPAPVTHLSCLDLEGKSRLSVCIGLLGGTLQIFSAEGVLQRTIPLSQKFQQQHDAYFGRVYTIHDLNIWQRDANGRAALVVGGYSTICFLDPDCNIIGHSWADGSWQNNILVTADSHDLWVRNGWNHGIGFYEGMPGLSPSGETIPFGGVNQPMFRGLRKVIPFVNGETTTFEWIGDTGNILAAAENGIGVLSTRQQAWLWKIEGGTPITACVSAGDTAIVGGSDGFIAAFAQSDGRPIRKLRLGATVTGLATLRSDWLAVATRAGLLVLDSDWHIRHSYRVSVRHLRQLTDERLVIVREDGHLEMLNRLW